MPTHTAEVGQLVTINPADSWIIQLPPNPVNGDFIAIKATTFDPTVVQIQTTDGSLIWDADLVTPQQAVAISLLGDSVYLTYNDGQPNGVAAWMSYSGTAMLSQWGRVSGPPATFSPGSSFTAVQNWPNTKHTAMFAPNPPANATGLITIPVPGSYRVNALLVFQQGNTNKELAALLWLRVNGTTDLVIDSIQISDDKTNWRSLKANFIYEDAAKFDTLQLGISWVNQSMGTCSFNSGTFEVEFVGAQDFTSVE